MNVERFVNGFFFVDVFFSKSSLNKNQLPRHGMSDGVLLNIYHIQTNKQTNNKRNNFSQGGGAGNNNKWNYCCINIYGGQHLLRVSLAITVDYVTVVREVFFAMIVLLVPALAVGR